MHWSATGSMTAWTTRTKDVVGIDLWTHTDDDVSRFLQTKETLPGFNFVTLHLSDLDKAKRHKIDGREFDRVGVTGGSGQGRGPKPGFRNREGTTIQTRLHQSNFCLVKGIFLAQTSVHCRFHTASSCSRC